MKAALVREPPQVSAGDMKNKLQPGAAKPGGPDRPSWGGAGGQPHPTALHSPSADFTMLPLFLTMG